MRQIRRTAYEAKVEIMPLIDVVFLLLTFFIYAIVLMVRIEVLPLPLETYSSSKSAEAKPSITITLAIDGNVYAGKDLVNIYELTQIVTEKKTREPDCVIYVVIESGQSIIDRGPILTSIWDRLNSMGLDILLVGNPNDESESNTK